MASRAFAAVAARSCAACNCACRYAISRWFTSSSVVSVRAVAGGVGFSGRAGATSPPAKRLSAGSPPGAGGGSASRIPPPGNSTLGGSASPDGAPARTGSGRATLAASMSVARPAATAARLGTDSPARATDWNGSMMVPAARAGAATPTLCAAPFSSPTSSRPCAGVIGMATSIVPFASADTPAMAHVGRSVWVARYSAAGLMMAVVASSSGPNAISAASPSVFGPNSSSPVTTVTGGLWSPGAAAMAVSPPSRGTVRRNPTALGSPPAPGSTTRSFCGRTAPPGTPTRGASMPSRFTAPAAAPAAPFTFSAYLIATASAPGIPAARNACDGSVPPGRRSMNRSTAPTRGGALGCAGAGAAAPGANSASNSLPPAAGAAPGANSAS